MSQALLDNQIKDLWRQAQNEGCVLKGAICEMALGMEYYGDPPSNGYPSLQPDERRQLDAMSVVCARKVCIGFIEAVRASSGSAVAIENHEPFSIPRNTLVFDRKQIPQSVDNTEN